MKRLILWMVVVALSTHVWADGEYHEFTDNQGRSIKGRIVSCDVKKKMVTIELENKHKATVSIVGFSKDDQTYILDWMRLDSVRSESKFKISFDRRRLDSWNEEILGAISYASGAVEKDQVVGKNSFEKTGFEITLNNRNDGPVDGLVLKYCIFYQQDVNVEGEAVPGVLYGEVSLNVIEKFSKQVITTDPVVTLKSEYDSSFLDAEVLSGDVIGIVVRLCTAGEGGGEVLRELSMPDSLRDEGKWVDESKPVGANVVAGD